MWVHIGIFIVVLVFFAGEKTGMLPAFYEENKKGKRLFLAVALAGNFLGAALTWQTGGEKIYREELRLKKEDTGSYEEKFFVSVDGEEAGSVYVQIPQKETSEEAQEETEVLTEEELRKRRLQEVLEEYNRKKTDPDYYYLPVQWEGQTLQWKKPGDSSGNLLAGLCLLGAMALMVLTAREGQTAKQKRQEQLLMDYPGLIMKFTLLVQAGMTPRKAFQKIAADYKKKEKGRRRDAYEGIVTACYEMDSGVSELEACRRYGERCGQVKYKTFSTLLMQNLQKGGRQLSDILEKESMEAWEERKRSARVRGETAAMKLLFPMMLMLLVVMAVIMIPAFLAFY